MRYLLMVREYLREKGCPLSGQLPKTQGKRTDLPNNGLGNTRDIYHHDHYKYYSFFSSRALILFSNFLLLLSIQICTAVNIRSVSGLEF